MKKFFDTCDVIDYCSPPPSPITPKSADEEWVITDNTNTKKSWKGWLLRTRNTVPTVPPINSEHLAQEVKRDS
jgi:hypothetical protein